MNSSARLATIALAGTLLAFGCDGDAVRPLLLGVPTTIQDSGLLDVLQSEFEAAHPGYRLRAVTAGSGELLELGARGDVDALISHSPAAELEFMAAGHGALRRQAMWNDFVIVGPRADPARVRGMDDPAAALRRIAGSGAPFLSRGDESGTHRKELELWGDVPAESRGAGYREFGDGMGAVLRVASELDAYTLTDRGTFRSLGGAHGLEILVESDARLRNVYSVIVATRAREPDGARLFAEWLTSAAGRRVIESFAVERFGEPLFRPVTDSLELNQGSR